MKKTFCAVGVLWVLGAVACGGIKEQDIGDGAGGSSAGSASALAGRSARGGTSGDDDNGATPLAGSATAHGGSTAVGGAPAGGDCEATCGEGRGCFHSYTDDYSVCAPLCEDQSQGQTPDAATSCGHSVNGGPGTCVFGLQYGPNIALPPNGTQLMWGNLVSGVCSNECDPLNPICSFGYGCDATGTYSAVAEQPLYACLPIVEQRQAGDDCEGTGSGSCGFGLTCTPLPAGIYKCQKFCDLSATSPCPGTQTCAASEVTTLVGSPNVGVCGD